MSLHLCPMWQNPTSFSSPHSSGFRSKLSCNISDCIPLLDAKGGAVSAVPAQKKPTQIGRLAADKREQFRVRAAFVGKALPDGVNADI